LTGDNSLETWQAIDFGWDTFDEETQFKKRHRAQPGPCRQMNPCPYGPTSNWASPSFPVILLLGMYKRKPFRIEDNVIRYIYSDISSDR
jgi:hypothetical protein